MFALLLFMASASPAQEPYTFRPDVPFADVQRGYADCLAAIAPSGFDRRLLKKRGWKGLKITATGDDALSPLPEILGRDQSFIMISLVTKDGRNSCNVSASVQGNDAYDRLLAYLGGQLSAPGADGKRTAMIEGRTVAVSRHDESGGHGTILINVSAPESR